VLREDDWKDSNCIIDRLKFCHFLVKAVETIDIHTEQDEIILINREAMRTSSKKNTFFRPQKIVAVFCINNEIFVILKTSISCFCFD